MLLAYFVCVIILQIFVRKNIAALIDTSSDSNEMNYGKRVDDNSQFDVHEKESARTITCIPLVRFFKLHLRKHLRADESIGVTGNHAQLGDWHVDKSPAMHTSDAHRANWHFRTIICTDERIQYRYFIYRKNCLGHRVVTRWEGTQYTRILGVIQVQYYPSPDYFGELYATTLGDVETERGWLRTEYAIEFKFVWQQHFVFETNLKTSQFLLKLMVKDATETTLSNTIIEVSRFAYNHSQLRPQSHKGLLYSAGDIVIFHVTETLKVRNSYELLITDLKERQIGRVYIPFGKLMQSEGSIRLTVLSAVSGFEIGYLFLPYLIIRPLPNALRLNMRGSYHRYWPPNWPTMNVGHRGAGKSFYDAEAPATENTIKSFLYVHQLSFEMVEFDIQLTKDYIAVLWYDFGFYTAPFGQNVQHELQLEYVLIKDLTYEELKSKRVFVSKLEYIQEITTLNVRSENVSERIFSTLADVYRSLPKALGLLVEISWPQLMSSGKMEAEQTLDKNRFVNAILETTGQHGCGRPIIFSSFDADICSMIRHKQNVFPVLFLSIGESTLWKSYMDLRTRGFMDAINFAQSENILGTALHAEEFLNNSRLIDYGLNLAQAVFLWGDVLNNAQVIESFKRVQPSGIIYDEMHLFGPNNKRRNFFDVYQLQEIFSRQCPAVSNWSSAISMRRLKRSKIGTKNVK